uniref:Peroxin-5 n=1 Tax=Acrobeloides nanus TaxID=290746 RepID=A0A914D5C2_9BILA
SWTALGLCHAENEQDLQAISAFRRALEIDPQSQDALLAISVSYANESMENEALSQLEKWISVYNKDQNAFENAGQRPNMFSNYSSLDPNKFNQVENSFLDAARRQGGSVDPDLQNALGVLYNLNRNFERAVDSIKAALAVRPDDARLWNRLGATLANGDRTAEAISAYRQALSLFPTYVRARYNLGISCMHLKSYSEAVDHFLSALQIQRSPENSPIWSTMRSAVLRVDPPPTPELIDSLDSRDPGRFAAALNQHRSLKF